jgi:hypothetical protein
MIHCDLVEFLLNYGIIFMIHIFLIILKTITVISLLMGLIFKCLT